MRSGPARCFTLAAALMVLALAGEAAARPGGGQSYSGGGRSYSGGSSSYSGRSYSGGSGSYSGGGGSYSGGGGGAPLSDGLIVLFLFGGLGLTVGLTRFNRRREAEQRFDSVRAPSPASRGRGSLRDLRARDPDFSAVLFEDYCYALYARVQAARSDPGAMDALSAHVSGPTRAALLAREPVGAPIHGVVIGKLRVSDVVIATSVHVELVIEANYTASSPDGPQTYYVEERWTLERGLEVTSKAPPEVYAFQCPSCGGPYERGDDGRCKRCAQQVEGGRFDWWLSGVVVLRQETRPPALTTSVEEQGTHLPSVLDPDIEREHAALAAADPAAGADALDRRVRQIHRALNDGWTRGDLRAVRPFVSDSLHNYLSYWIDAYRAQGLRNVLEAMEVSRTQVVKLTRDHHYDAVTLRVWAHGLDYTIAVADGRYVCGNLRRPRAYSEYWTLIRGAKVRGAPRSSGTCPNCGASLERINMAGNCEACGSHLTRGEFDWVLSRIEQDDSYAG